MDEDSDEDTNDEYTVSSDTDNSATEISTDSEFERNGTSAITSGIPNIIITESAPVRKGYLEEVRKVQIVNSKNGTIDCALASKNVAVSNAVPQKKEDLCNIKVSPLMNPRKGDYFLNRTQSTEGIASKISLELKKKYLLGANDVTNPVKKSGSTSVLDTRFKNFVDQISEHQKLLNPNPEPSQTMQTFLETTNKLRTSPILMLNYKKAKELDGIDEFQHICNRAEKPTENNTHLEKTVCTNNSQNVRQSENKIESESTVKTNSGNETTIYVPELPKGSHIVRNSGGTESETTDDSSTEQEAEQEDGYHNTAQILLPKVEIRNALGELMPNELEHTNVLEMKKEKHIKNNSVINQEANNVPESTRPNFDLCLNGNICNKSNETANNSLNKIIAVPMAEQTNQNDREAQILKQVSTPADLFFSSNKAASASNDSNISVNSNGLHSDKSSSSTPTSLHGDESTLAIFTETELSDWARDEDGTVSENLDDFAILNMKNVTYRRHQKQNTTKHNNRGIMCSKLASPDKLDNQFIHVCGKKNEEKSSLSLSNMDNIEYMDTLNDDDNDDNDAATEHDDHELEEGNKRIDRILLENSGYIEYVTSDEAKTPPFETVNDYQIFPKKQDVSNEHLYIKFGMAGNQTPAIFSPEKDLLENKNSSKLQDECIGDVNNCKLLAGEHYFELNNDYGKFIHRLQDRISPFSNAKDSIDIRKSKKHNGKSSTIATVEAFEHVDYNKLLTNPTLNPSKKLEELSRQRSLQKSLIHEMVMNKLQMEGKYDKKLKKVSQGSAHSNSGSQNSVLSDNDEFRGAAWSGKSDGKSDHCEVSKNQIYHLTNSNNENHPIKNDDIQFTTISGNDDNHFNYELLLNASDVSSPMFSSSNENSIKCLESSYSLPDIRKALLESEPKTPAESCSSREGILKLSEGIKESARIRARLMSDSELGLSPEEKLKLLKDRLLSRKKVKSAYDSFDKNNICDFDDIDDAIIALKYSHTPESLSPGKQTNKGVDKDRRKRSIIQAVSDFFHKKTSPSPSTSPSHFSSSHSPNRIMKFTIPLKGKEKSKDKRQNDNTNRTVSPEKKSTDDFEQRLYSLDDPTPVRKKSEENISEMNDQCTISCDDQDNQSTLSSRQIRTSKRLARQAHLKRLRMAQEIQRQLEEIEVKQKELESRGVNVEKALRGENKKNLTDENQLMQELLELMQERNELQRYERKLLTRAQEIEQEDRNARHQG